MQFKLEGKKTLLKGFFSIEEQTFLNESTGARFKRMRVVPKEAAAILLYLEEEDKVILGRQYRTPFAGTDTNPYFLEIPAGVIDDGESAEQSIKRESEEETGYEVKKVRLIHTIHSSPGYTAEKLHIYFGKVSRSDKKNHGGGTDDHEEIEIIEIPFDEAWKMVQSGKLTDSKTIIALYWLANRR